MVRALFLSALFAASVVAQPPGNPPPAVPFAITDPDDKGGTVVPVINATYPYVAGTYPAALFAGKNIYVTIIDQNGNVIERGQAAMKDGAFAWQSANAYDPVNPVFIWADTGKFGVSTNSVKANMK
jgi:hypothetical protein